MLRFWQNWTQKTRLQIQGCCLQWMWTRRAHSTRMRSEKNIFQAILTIGIFSPSNERGTTLARPANRHACVSIGAETTLKSNVLQISVQNYNMKAIVDTAASISSHKLELQEVVFEMPLVVLNSKSISMGVYCFRNIMFLHRLHFSVILGMDFLTNNKVLLNLSQNTIILPNSKLLSFFV